MYTVTHEYRIHIIQLKFSLDTDNIEDIKTNQLFYTT